MDRPNADSVKREEHLAFLQVLFRAPARTGAVAPSSVHLARAMVKGLTLGPGQTVVEFGPGTGALTSEIRRILPSPSSYLGVEIEPRFADLLRRRFPGLHVVEGSAEEAPRFVAEAGCAQVKAVICGLPFATLPAGVQDRVVHALDVLVGPGAQFRTFQYIHAYPLPPAVRFRHRMRELFGPHTREATVVRNLPPAYVLSWSR
jgi:phosphatidylethanolamine/phosphatidyl-N-methylethanolamine N-methyltransferase